MLNVLINTAKELAEKLNIERIVLITKSDVEKDIRVTTTPKSFASLIDTIISQIDDSDKFFLERIIHLKGINEFVASFFYLKGIEDKRSLIVVDTDSLKAITVLNLEESNFLKTIKNCSERVDPEVLRSILRISMNIAFKGREGKRMGAAFVIGDVEEVLNRSVQIVLNPFAGYNEKDRDVKDSKVWGSIIEFAQIDGVFVVDEKGTMVAAGRYIEVSPRDLNLRTGIGGRHLACAAITRETKAIAVVVSETGGDITVYKDGEEILRIQPYVYI